MPGKARRGRPPSDDVLTPTEWRVVHAVQHGLSNREIAARRGAPRGSAVARKEKIMTTTQLGPLAQVSRTVRDIKESETWYGTTLGSSAFFDCGGTRLYLSESAKPGSESILYLRVADIRAVHDALRARGVEFAQTPHMIHRHADGTQEWLAHFNDPEGRPLGLRR